MLRDLKDYFKNTFPWALPISIGKIDNSKDKAICFYNSRFSPGKIPTVGGNQNRSYKVHPVTLLIRWGTNAHEAEEKAEEIYKFFDEREFIIGEKRVFIISKYEGPIDLGTDEQGIYEYSVEFDLYEIK